MVEMGRACGKVGIAGARKMGLSVGGLVQHLVAADNSVRAHGRNEQAPDASAAQASFFRKATMGRAVAANIG